MSQALTYIEVDTDAFDDESSPIAEQTWRFGRCADFYPASIRAIPSLAALSYSPGTLNPGRDLGTRSVLTLRFDDHPHVMNGESYAAGTFWSKWRARYGQRLRGRPVRWIQGYVGQSLGEMTTRHLVIDSVDGPNAGGAYKIIAKDLLKFADDERAQAPALSNGFLAAAISSGDGSLTLSPVGIGDAEYPSSGHVAIAGDEICAFTRSGDTLSLTRAQKNTAASDHDIGDRVQVVLSYSAQDPADIISDLLTTYAGVPSSSIPITAWRSETAAYLQRLYSADIAEPVGVNTLVSELVEQAGLSVWYDLETRLVRLQVLRAIPTDVATFDEGRIGEGPLGIQDQPRKRISQVWTYFAQRNPLEPLDEPQNFRSVVATQDLAAEADYGGAAIKKIYSRWIPFGGRNVAQRLNQIQLAQYRDPPRRFGVRHWRSDSSLSPMLGGGYRIAASVLTDKLGAAAPAPIQIVRLNPGDAWIEFEAEEMLFSGDSGADLVNRTVTLDVSNFDLNLRAIHDSLYPELTGAESPSVTVTFVIEEGAIIGSTSIGSPAVTVGEWPDGVDVVLEVRGRIQGAGGRGGSAGSDKEGRDGGVALQARSALSLILDAGQAEIWGGGGGGGAAGDNGPRGGGGGGAGYLPGEGRSGATGGADGQDGTTESGGDGGQNTGPLDGGDGGDPGQPGDDGAGASHGNGGAAGAAIDGVSFVTKVGAGDIRGGEIN